MGLPALASDAAAHLRGRARLSPTGTVQVATNVWLIGGDTQ